MAWLIGIDEAGYGPNLGPMIVTAVACQVPDQRGKVDLWQKLKRCVRRHDEEADDRLVVADSKEVYSTARGLAELEATALAALTGGFFAGEDGASLQLKPLLQRLAVDHVEDLVRESWFVGDMPLPARGAAATIAQARERLRAASSAAKVHWGFCRSAVICTPRFNAIIERWDSKAVVTGLTLVHLLQACLQGTSAEPMYFVVDKLGGRNQYGVLLQEAFHAGLVFPEEEGMLRSSYRVEGLDRPVRALFVPRADAEHFTVALASMVSKYVRELLMIEFNRFWQTHVPGLKATAGYPGDAARYFDEIRPVLGRLGLQESQVWRCR
jgi:ribonuclease HII